MIKLNDIFNIENLSDYKIRLNKTIGGGAEEIRPAIDVYFENVKRYEQACAWNGKYKALNKPNLITFAQMKNREDLWLFTGVYRVKDFETKNKKSNSTHFELSCLEEVTEFHKYCGRLIVKFHKSIQAYIIQADNFMKDLEIHEILDREYDNEYFKGYQNVDLSFLQLKHIYKSQNISWKTALENSKGVYLITDDKNGKMYVGSAYGENMIWKRWNDYVKTGHGGNKELKRVVKEKGLDYIQKHFHYSILEHFVSSVEDKKIIERETYWKNILQSKKFGYNDN